MCNSQCQTLLNALLSLKEPLMKLPDGNHDGLNQLHMLTQNIAYVVKLIRIYCNTTQKPNKVQQGFLE